MADSAPPSREETDPFDPYADVFGLSSTSVTSSAQPQSLGSSGSPFSPLGHVASAQTAVDVFAPAATASGSEGVLLSLSPLAQPAGVSSTSGSDRFSSFQGLSSSSIAPPPQRPASFSGSGVSEGLLLSFSPVATLPPAPSFFASSAGGSTASGSSAFGNDDLFSLSMDQSMSATSITSTSSAAEKVTEPAIAMDLAQTPPSAFGFMDSASSSHSSSASFGVTSSDSAFPVQDVFATPLDPFDLSAQETSGSSSLHGSFVSAEPLLVDPPAHFDTEDKMETQITDEMHEAQDGLAEIDLLQAAAPLSEFDDMNTEASAETAELQFEAASPAPFQEISSSQASDSEDSVDKHHEEQADAFDSFAVATVEVALEKSDDSFSFDTAEPNLPDAIEPEVITTSNDSFSFDNQESSVSDEIVPEVATSHSHDDLAEISAPFSNDDDFGDFGSTGNEIKFAAVAPKDKALTESSTSTFNVMESDDFGDFAQESSSTIEPAGFDENDDDGFGNFAQSSNSATGFGDDDDGFGDFAQSSGATGGDDEDDGFGDFSSGGFQASSSANDDGFGDFSSPPQVPEEPLFTPSIVPQSLNIPIASKQDVADFFCQAFAASSATTGKQLLDSAGTGINSVQLFQEQLGNVNNALERVFISELNNYASAKQISSAPVEAIEELSDSKTLSLKYLKYVLTAKIQEATRYNGIFPEGSEKHQHFESIANSGNEEAIRDAVAQLQEELFHSSVNDAMMRLAKQAALSAKAKIAEQAALQQASSRTSILTTTRNLLSRGGGASERDVSSSNASGSNAQSAASNKSARHEDKMGGSGDETGSDSAAADHHSGHSSDPETHTATASAPRSTGSGGLMKKFQDRFSPFSSSRSKPRTVSLRRMGESGEEVRTMEINMDSINGGFDEVKWKCAVFLYDVEEVAHVAPSQIQILSYPGKELLSGKSDRSALVKLLKPGTIWSIDIGANNSDVLNEW